MKYHLKYHLKVYDSKYREFLNVIDNSLSKQKPVNCISRSAFQSINDMHLFEYIQEWTDLERLKEYLKSNEFKSLLGAFQLLTTIENFSITESKELEKTSLFQETQ